MLDNVDNMALPLGPKVFIPGTMAIDMGPHMFSPPLLTLDGSVTTDTSTRVS